MCGIFGVIANKNSDISSAQLSKIVKKLFILSESRGKDASGISFFYGDNIDVYKKSISGKEIIEENTYNNIYTNFTKTSFSGVDAPMIPFAVIGHARMATNGSLKDNHDNHPIIKDSVVGVHNGIIVNTEALWEKHKNINKLYKVDTEILLGLLDLFINQGNSIEASIVNTFNQIQGYTSTAIVSRDFNTVILSSNNGSLYTLYDEKKKFFIFASEQNILLSVRKKLKYFLNENYQKIQQVPANSSVIIDIETLNVSKIDHMNFTLNRSLYSKCKNRKIKDYSTYEKINNELKNKEIVSTDYNKHFEIVEKKVSTIRRCTKCVLPETMPFIKFDENGVCNYCRDYKKIKFKGHNELKIKLSKVVKKNNRPDCMVMFSGGRDSCYSLHYLKTKLNMNPIAYSYDWGMITDLGRRNQSRLCGKLGIEHILISADIRKKRKNIKKNVLAWLKKPDLGTIPLFMAGDKQYLYHANKLREQLNIEHTILGINLFEKSDFKWGFCGIEPKADSHYKLSLNEKIKQAYYYGKNYLANPAFFNSSLFDTLGAYFSFYFIPHDYLNIFEYIKWDEDEINSVLINEYEWETAKDTDTTWRIGDGTAPFYNYIYYMMAGFTENDTLRSNQIREEVIDREKALELVIKENKPRWDSMLWYCNTIGIDFDDTIKRINNFPRIF
ncbi:MAG: Glutamine amidotransferase class-II [Candidatus Falkowbacteria bacterium GW2011_GWC2_38_22]|uniref:Glutamine--fructose-6-phosphate aminotransferase [isomerizing] n=1 Tax=Candidatus Falkowbacteria bacterium GW2011_GWE1_38_31 TaxID=1618638 RepID=A0A0G0N2D1_9BACT|nr:MAG: Glutamine amidotransferase class-II [Candidatus Falkowbacteria bacterium GW2011_GWF2_38_1205]KKQ61857.1 MAG: Glutamine amidotransferase class-II [Candidatus Falkowbacteria bacterium GW2011_GWC2_38_22]KKQ64165.1 MAG: Glutamine amidotransferase class-II [Candidatus Falkowbacteria bacterium GW2011_GWF1_38_22]KKQ66485.1 MAG: Glutamine amidotransferase class-II [Candidatus Falkowbacteria bacterium GW2011_GWE2_38_254]KKQ71271.1 MAG: Glutamine amidotransferase class-II [Candidatus Falkowbacter